VAQDSLISTVTYCLTNCIEFEGKLKLIALRCNKIAETESTKKIDRPMAKNASERLKQITKDNLESIKLIFLRCTICNVARRLNGLVKSY